MKTTLATVKAFARKNVVNLYVRTTHRFDGMVDGVRPVEGNQFRKVAYVDMSQPRTLGIPGAWFVGDSKDYFTPYNQDGYVGYEIYNCTGTFILAVKQQ